MMRIPESVKQRRDRTDKIIAVLEREYADAPLELNYANGFELLIAVMLSAQCTDARVNQVTAALFERYRSPADFVGVSRLQLEKEIRPTGFYRNKATAIQQCCRELLERHGGRLPEEIDTLVKLPGVGRKTAAMVLGNAFGIQAGIAVDTHVRRVAARLGLSQAKTVEKVEKDLIALIPGRLWTWFSNALILHGRRVCKARTPECPRCGMASHCPHPEKTP